MFFVSFISIKNRFGDLDKMVDGNIDSTNCSTFKNLVLIVIPNYLGKDVNRTSQIKIVIYRNI